MKLLNNKLFLPEKVIINIKKKHITVRTIHSTFYLESKTNKCYTYLLLLQYLQAKKKSCRIRKHVKCLRKIDMSIR